MPFFVVVQVALFAPFVLFPFAAGMAVSLVVHKAFLVVHKAVLAVHRAFLVDYRGTAAVAWLGDKVAAFLGRHS